VDNVQREIIAALGVAGVFDAKGEPTKQAEYGTANEWAFIH